MNHGWEYKRLGDVCEIERGGSPRPIQDYITDDPDGLNWIKIGDASDSKYITSTKEKIKKEGLKKTRFVHKGDFILSNSMSFGRPYILAIDGCIHDGWLVLHDSKGTFDKSYLYYFLSSPTTYAEFKRLANCGVVSNLNSNIVRGVKVAIPPISEQTAIVAELDKINEAIEIKRRQLAELDSLAQSIFYDTFGDPITNPKGWPTKSLNLVAPQMPYEGTVPSVGNKYWLLNLDMIEKHSGRIIEHQYVAEDEIGQSTYQIKPGQVLYSKLRPNLNKVVIADDFGFCTSELLPLNPHLELIVPVLLAYMLRSKECVNLFSGKVAGAKMPRTDLKTFRSFQVPLPPLTMQHKFDERVEQIDAQKKTVVETIAELQTLLDSRMDYWFND